MKKQGCVLLQFSFPPARSTHPLTYPHPPSPGELTGQRWCLEASPRINVLGKSNMKASCYLGGRPPRRRGGREHRRLRCRKTSCSSPVAWFLFAAGSWLVLPVHKMCHLPLLSGAAGSLASPRFSSCGRKRGWDAVFGMTGERAAQR